MKAKKVILAAAAAAVAAAAAAAVVVWPYLMTGAPSSATILISDAESPLRQLADAEGEEFASRVERAAKWMEVDYSRRLGAYKIAAGETPCQVARKIRNYDQTGVRVTFNNIRTLDQLADKLTQRLMMSSDDLLALLRDKQFCDSIGKTPENVAVIFIPDTYEFYYTVTPERLVNRFLSLYNKFWNQERTAKAAALGLSPEQVAILASIVEEETAKTDERGTVARLYINRLQRGMRLQADPTVKFALGDFSIRRLTYSHLEVQSPYNTYLADGLPPGPIRLPERATLEAVINAPEHNYIYMCARDDFSGYHNFTTSLSQHNLNAARYHAALKSRGIR